ncbi:hypothetical protein PVAP13_1KG459905 [Panicum virgatum]|uniref:Uncharacterized protein n=1 Tax=Panicum virgatum TaxID=38727 RepID=A0A8T0XLL0_PANVG|nr:hypothetical protein PVAP13_1KG459905 [Panicum virgatum]
MAALSDFHFDEDGWVRSTCLHREGLPVLLWEVLQEFGYTESPQYYGRVSSEGGISGWEARLRVPARLGLFPSDSWEVHTEGAEILSVWDRAAAMAITQFCEQEPIFASYSASTVGFPVRVTSEYSRQRFSLLLDSTLPGHVPALARIARYAAGQSQQLAEQSQQVVGLAQQFWEQEQRIVEQAQQILEQSQQLEEQSQQLAEQTEQLAEQAQQIEELTEQVDDQEALADHLQDALQVALGNVHQLQLQQQQAAAPPEPPPQVSGVESGVGPQEMSDAESSVDQNDVPPQAGSTAILVNEQNVGRLQEELRARGIEVERVFEYQPPR